ncbi:MAG: DUF4129 domain-containing protein [Gemmatimonas sp.]
MTRPAMQQAPAWSESAIRDTIATIAKGADYQRALTESLWDRLTRWIWERVVDLISTVGSSGRTRTITIAMVVIILLLIVARIAIGINAERRLRHAGPLPRANVGGATLLASAESLAAKGEFTAAAHALYGALLAACAARGDLRLHASKTTGDYARELRNRNSPTLRAFQSFRLRYDRVIYGDMRCSADDYTALSLDARALIVPGSSGQLSGERAA